MRRYRKASLAILIMAMLVPAAAWAGAEGRLSGTIVDESGKGVEGVTVTLIELANDKREVKETNKKGRFSFLILDSTADFGIRMEKQGWITIQEGVDPQAGGTTRLEWTMKQGSALEAGAAAPADPAAAPKGTRAAIEAYNAGAEAYNVGDRAAAIAKFGEAIELDPTMEAGYKALAEVYLAEERIDDALATTAKYIEVAPDSAQAISLRYDTLKEAGRGAEGTALLDALVEKDPSPETAVRLFNMGLDASRNGQLETALAGFSRALQIDPNLGQAYLGVADTYLRLGRVRQGARARGGRSRADARQPERQPGRVPGLPAAR